MSVIIGHASISEKNSVTGMKGDQTGKEVCMRNWYNKPWTNIIRPVNHELAERMANICETLCKNENIGYDQTGRNSLHNELKKINYDYKKLIVPCNCDCSSFMHVIAIASGLTEMEYTNNACTTTTMTNFFVKTGKFINITDSNILSNDKYLKRGDILVSKGSHTVMVLSDGINANIIKTKSEPKDIKVKSKGIDISKWQANRIDFDAAMKAGYDFVIIRIGYNSTKDSYFESNYNKAIASGMKVGVYLYTTGLTSEQAVFDAKVVLKWLQFRKLDFPIAYDLEENSMKSASRKNINSEMYNAFSNEIKKNSNYRCMLYTGENMFNNYFNKDMISDPLWIAKYSSNQPNIGKQVAIWQYTSDSIPSDFYADKLDRNEMLIDYNTLMKEIKPTEKKIYGYDDFINDVFVILGVNSKNTAITKTVTISVQDNKNHKLVTPLERYMKALGYYNGTIEDDIGKTPDFGKGMEKAIKQYQKEIVKASVQNQDGIITAGKSTWKKLLGII